MSNFTPECRQCTYNRLPILHKSLQSLIAFWFFRLSCGHGIYRHLPNLQRLSHRSRRQRRVFRWRAGRDLIAIGEGDIDRRHGEVDGRGAVGDVFGEAGDGYAFGYVAVAGWYDLTGKLVNDVCMLG